MAAGLIPMRGEIRFTDVRMCLIFSFNIKEGKLFRMCDAVEFTIQALIFILFP